MKTTNYSNVKKEAEEKLSLLIKDCHVFFAFSNKQFEENKTPLKQGEKYVSFGSGCYIPKSNLERFRAGNKEIDLWKKQQIKKGKIQEQEILYELNNHECFYTCSIEDALDVLSDDYTFKEVLAVYNKHKKNIQEQQC
jgi:hypothetical protein